ncbi:MAG: hypothetical protein LBC60_07655, partial [Spirochaetaceae bacterium]|nr:hypothetical protein [Spirochaetaceae bacterium]
MTEKNRLGQGRIGRHLTASGCVMFIILFGFAAIQIFPLIWLLNFSFASSTEMFTKGILVRPERIRWDNYYKAFVDGHFLLYLKNSLLINTLAVLIVLVTSVMAAFACSRMRWKLSA